MLKTTEEISLYMATTILLGQMYEATPFHIWLCPFVWGCFSEIGQGLLAPIKGNLNAARYNDILDNNSVLPTL